ncbi:MAG: aminopeptidase [Burkholderiales bacterium]|nr:aminopeptidase [Burkholderiales bacterium]
MRLRLLTLLALLAPLLGGCATLRYYVQAVNGQLELLRLATPIDEELSRDSVPTALKSRLRAALRIREFASRDLSLPDNGSYKRYADLGRRYVLWNVFAAEEFSIKPVTSCFPVAGCVSYRGYFGEADAQADAARQRERGYDVYVGGVPAYSTLGWFDDPVLNTFIHYPDAELARLMFHELAHQVLYVKDDTRFNESFAVTVEQAGVARWLEKNGNADTRAAHARLRGIRQEFVALLLRYRAILDEYYRRDLAPEQQRLGKAQRFAEMEEEYRQLKISWGGFAGYDRWFAGKPNNATLASVSLYTELVPAFTALLEREGGNLPRFYAAVKELANLPKAERDARLQALVAN